MFNYMEEEATDATPVLASKDQTTCCLHLQKISKLCYDDFSIVNHFLNLIYVNQQKNMKETVFEGL